MNLILLHPDDFSVPGKVTLVDRRAKHIKRVIRPEIGDTVVVGLLNGKVGRGEVTRLDKDGVDIEVVFDTAPPAPLPITLVMALPRPKALFKSLQTMSTMGVKDLHLVNASKVDKSYWSSHRLTEEAIREHLILGLEQAKDTVMPKVTLHRRFSHFVNDVLPALMVGKTGYVAHPSEHAIPCPHQVSGKSIVALGPERGFIDYEVSRLVEAGFVQIDVGRRILRVEQALPVVLAKLTP